MNMPKFKATRKRKHASESKDITYEVDGPSAKFRPFDEEAQAEEEHLSRILFGGGSSFLKYLEESQQETGSSQNSVIDSGVEEGGSSDSEENIRKPAWVDEDDDGIEVGQALDAQRRKLPSGGINSRNNKYSTLLKHKFKSSVGAPQWAQLSKQRNSSSDSDDDILQSCGFIRKSTRTSLPSGFLEFKKVTDLNRDTYSEGPYINAIEFHPTSTVGLVTGNSGIATLFAVDGKRNKKLHSVAFERFPIFCAKFAQSGNEVLLGSRHSHIFSYDLIAAKPLRVNLPQGLTQFKNFIFSPDSKIIAAAGKWGEVHLLSCASKERIGLLKQDSEVTALTYSPAGNLLFGHSESGEVTLWDMNMTRVKHKFTDEGCLMGTRLAVSSSNQFLASGSAQGVVNLYGMEDLLQSNLPKPRKTILNLTTAISDLKFNPSSEILAISSVEIQNAVKLFHVGSGTVFTNFPNFETKMGHTNVLNFSPNSGYIAFGNNKSITSLYRLKHYKNY